MIRFLLITTYKPRLSKKSFDFFQISKLKHSRNSVTGNVNEKNPDAKGLVSDAKYLGKNHTKRIFIRRAKPSLFDITAFDSSS
jgi:hypothetical protein